MDKERGEVPPMSSLDDIAGSFGLGPEVVSALERFDRLFMETAAHTNLVARGGLPDRWQRHYADSLQLSKFLPTHTRHVLDVGSGAGFPGLVLAILLANQSPATQITLVDSVGKKAAFLRRAVDELSLTNTDVIGDRLERQGDLHRRFDVILARAVTALDHLLDLTAPFLADGGTMIFPKGESVERELAEAELRWTFHVKQCASKTRMGATILLIQEPKRRQ